MVALFVIMTILVCVGIDGVVQWRKAKREYVSRNLADQLVPAAAFLDLSAPANLFLDSGHTWVEVKPSGAATIGLDGFAQKLIGRIDDVVLPEVGKQINRGDVLFAVKQDNHRAAFASPIDGEVVVVDRELPWHPEVIQSDPYRAGWICSVKPKNLAKNLKQLVAAEEARDWLKDEAQRFQEFFAAQAVDNLQLGQVRSLHRRGRRNLVAQRGKNDHHSANQTESEFQAEIDRRRESQAAQFDGEIPHQLTREERTHIFIDQNGHRTLSVINPIENEPSCSNGSCHAHAADTKVLGMINVRMSLDGVDSAITASRRQMVTSFIVAVVFLSLIFATLIWLMVHKPIRQLIAGTNQVAAGELDYKIRVQSRDEVGELAHSFNRMTGELKRAHAEISNWTRTLEERVEKKTAELQQAQEHVLRVEKLASIGKLAAIVAHEINNPLAGILVYARLVLKRLARNGSKEAEPETMKHVETIAAESARCGEIVKGLLQFSRQTKPRVKPNNLNDIITETLRLVRHKMELTGARAVTKCDPNVKQIVCDEQQLKQALVALLINACEAVHPGEGEITISSRYVSDGQGAEIRISDNGVGMDQETKQHIFEPFFTTKEQGKGVGLGLAVVYGIITGHGGEIEVESAPGCGTTFVLKLPDRVAEVEDSPSRWERAGGGF